jgi:uncharacterized membrane protein YfcA
MNLPKVDKTWPLILGPLGGWGVNYLQGDHYSVVPSLLLTCVLFLLWVGAVSFQRRKARSSRVAERKTSHLDL